MTAEFRPTCSGCGKPIPKGRLEALGSATTTCVLCSDAVRKTAADVDIALADGESPQPGNNDGKSMGRSV